MTNLIIGIVIDSANFSSDINNVFSTRKIIIKLIKIPLIKPKILPIITFKNPNPIFFINLLNIAAKIDANNKIITKIVA